MTFAPVQRAPKDRALGVRTVVFFVAVIVLSVLLSLLSNSPEKIGVFRWFATLFSALATLGASVVYILWKRIGRRRPSTSNSANRPIG
jgi:Na+/proline symporter